ncbi:hypothetical protein [Paenibacillus roseus]|uniref:hypothetical protein n=1 Tax=Paenibacillus sp. GCM10012307 TaxID=3317343 RepID=UPI0036D3A56D
MFDIWKTLNAPTIFYVGVGAFESFNHWFLKFDKFDLDIESASISAKIPAYIVHFITFTVAGMIIDKIVTTIQTLRGKTNQK